jgi:hypothetical protein
MTLDSAQEVDLAWVRDFSAVGIIQAYRPECRGGEGRGAAGAGD